MEMDHEMQYSLLIKKQAKKTLQSLSRPDRNRITEKIMALGADPDDPARYQALAGTALLQATGRWLADHL